MSTSELVITELVFDNFFKDLEIEAIVAILSCMVSWFLFYFRITNDNIVSPTRINMFLICDFLE